MWKSPIYPKSQAATDTSLPTIKSWAISFKVIDGQLKNKGLVWTWLLPSGFCHRIAIQKQNCILSNVAWTCASHDPLVIEIHPTPFLLTTYAKVKHVSLPFEKINVFFLTAGGSRAQNRGFYTTKRRINLMSADYIITVQTVSSKQSCSTRKTENGGVGVCGLGNKK